MKRVVSIGRVDKPHWAIVALCAVAAAFSLTAVCPGGADG